MYELPNYGLMSLLTISDWSNLTLNNNKKFIGEIAMIIGY